VAERLFAAPGACQKLDHTDVAVGVAWSERHRFLQLSEPLVDTLDGTQPQIQLGPAHGATEERSLHRGDHPLVDGAAQNQPGDKLLHLGPVGKVRQHQRDTALALHAALHQIEEGAFGQPIAQLAGAAGGLVARQQLLGTDGRPYPLAPHQHPLGQRAAGNVAAHRQRHGLGSLGARLPLFLAVRR
jgi:hypothetical protein